MLVPENAFFRAIYFEDLDAATFAPSPVTSGAVSAFLATSSDPTATAADPTLIVPAAHVGVAAPTAEQFPLGTWGVSFDAGTLSTALLESLFGASRTAYLIVVRQGARVFEQLRYVRSAAAEEGTVSLVAT